jgi:serine protease Do
VTVKLEEMPTEEPAAPTLASTTPQRQPTRGQSVLEDLLSPVPRTKAFLGPPPPQEGDEDADGSEDGAPMP